MAAGNHDRCGSTGRLPGRCMALTCCSLVVLQLGKHTEREEEVVATCDIAYLDNLLTHYLSSLYTQQQQHETIHNATLLTHHTTHTHQHTHSTDTRLPHSSLDRRGVPGLSRLVFAASFS